MTLGSRALDGWPVLMLLLGAAASLAWTVFVLWAALQGLRWLFE